MHTSLEETIYEDDFHKISYNATRDYISYTATGAPKDSTHLRHGLLKILEVPKMNHRPIRTYMADLRGVTTSPSMDKIWLNEVLLPQILHRGVKKMAWVVPNQVLPRLAMDYMVNKVVPQSCELRFFDNPEEAQRWLDESNEGF